MIEKLMRHTRTPHLAVLALLATAGLAINAWQDGRQKVRFQAAVSTACPNGIVEGGEACDDANGNPGDGCSATCTIEQNYGCATDGNGRSICVNCGSNMVSKTDLAAMGFYSTGLDSSGQPQTVDESCSTVLNEGKYKGFDLDTLVNFTPVVVGSTNNAWFKPKDTAQWITRDSCYGETEGVDQVYTSQLSGVNTAMEVYALAAADNALLLGAGSATTAVGGFGNTSHAVIAVPQNASVFTMSLKDFGPTAGGAYIDFLCGKPVECGDGTVNAGEQCDDGGTDPGDGCSATCTLETSPTLIAHWPLITNAQDISGNNHNGSLIGNATVNGCLQLNGVSFSDTVAIPNDRAFDVADNSQFTITGWVRTSCTDPMSLLFKHINVDGNDFPNGYVLMLNNPDTTNHCLAGSEGRAMGYVSGNTDNDACSNNPMNDGNWHHLAMTYDGQANKISLYVDGTKQSDTTAQRDAMIANGVELHIGSGRGNIGDVAMYSGILSQSEIQAAAQQAPPSCTEQYSCQTTQNSSSSSRAGGSASSSKNGTQTSSSRNQTSNSSTQQSSEDFGFTGVPCTSQSNCGSNQNCVNGECMEETTFCPVP